MRRLEAVWTRILGVLLILLGLALFVSPRIPYTGRERIRNTPYRVRRDEVIVIPRPIAVLIASAGVLALLLARGPDERP